MRRCLFYIGSMISSICSLNIPNHGAISSIGTIFLSRRLEERYD